MAGAKLDSVKYTNMFKAYGAFWRRGFTEWAGTASRSEYWWTYLVNVLIGLAVFIVFLFLGIFAVNVGLEGVINFDIVVSSLRVWIKFVVYGVVGGCCYIELGCRVGIEGQPCCEYHACNYILY